MHAIRGEKHQEINASEDEKLECVLMRSDSEAIAINLPEIEPVEKPESVKVSASYLPGLSIPRCRSVGRSRWRLTVVVVVDRSNT